MPSRKIHKVLVAARGEIAVRIIRTLKKLSISSVAIYADNDTEEREIDRLVYDLYGLTLQQVQGKRLTKSQ
ncbi:MAG: hypothetical protein MJZ85_09395 [Bacteroidales bacterium]|nr:hypothetical protein [Bacteroidales bacterium]